MKPSIQIKRVYDLSGNVGENSILIDRLWPRGISKETLKNAEWAKELAPSPTLRKWFNHEVDKWEKFSKKYRAELRDNPEVAAFIAAHKEDKEITLLFAAKDATHNNAIVLQKYLAEQF